MQVNINGDARLSLSDRLIRRSATSLISFYQRYISPHKGFRCAHRVYHGGQSCSGYAKTAVQTYGLGAAMPLVRQRFSDCGQAARVMKSQAAFSRAQPSFDRSDTDKRSQNSNCWADAACDCATYGCPNPDVSDCGLLDGCDIGVDGCDGCGDLDLGGCDGCDGCDVAGCDF